MSRSGCEMRTPATVDMRQSAVGVGAALPLVETRRTRVGRVALAFAVVALATLDPGPDLVAAVGAQRPAHIIRFLEATLRAAPDLAAVCSLPVRLGVIAG